MRRRLPDERRAIVHRFEIDGKEGYLIIGMYDDNTPGEVFIMMAKEGSTLSGLLDSVAIMLSMALQRDVPLEHIVGKFANVRYEPSGTTRHECIPNASSITDYVARYLGLKFLPLEVLREVGVQTECHSCDKVIRHGDRTYSCFAELPLGKEKKEEAAH